MSTNPGPSSSSNPSGSFIVKRDHILEISELLSNESLNWDLIAWELIEQKYWAEIKNEKDVTLKILRILDCWINRYGKETKFCNLLKIVKKQNKHAEENLIEKFEHLLYGQNISHNNSKDSEFWQVPDRNIDFTGRSTILENMESKVDFDSIKTSVCKIVLIAMGGSGKSSIATEFLYRNKLKFSNIFWINSEVKLKFLKQFQEIGRRQNVTSNEHDPEVYAKNLIEDWFEKSVNSNWILVLDNVEEQKDISKFIPRFGGVVIITTRNSHWRNFNKFKIERFEMAESIDLMRKFLGFNDISEIENILEFEEISQKLGHLPLAITVASYYIQFNGISVALYLKKIHEYTNKMLTYDEIEGIDKSLYMSIKITLDKIAEENSLAFEWIQVSSYMMPDHDVVPKENLETFLEIKSQKDQFLNVHSVILKYGLFELQKPAHDSSSEFYKVHRLIKKSIQIGIENKEDVFMIAMKIFRDFYISHILIMYATNLYLDVIEFSKSLSSNDITRIKKLNNVINMYVDMSNGQPSAIFTSDKTDIFNPYKDYVAAFENILTDPDSLWQIYKNFAIFSQDKAEQIEYFEKSFEICKTSYGLNHKSTADCVVNLLGLYCNSTDFKKCLDVFEIFTKCYQTIDDKVVLIKASTTLLTSFVRCCSEFGFFEKSQESYNLGMNIWASMKFPKRK